MAPVRGWIRLINAQLAGANISRRQPASLHEPITNLFTPCSGQGLDVLDCVQVIAAERDHWWPIDGARPAANRRHRFHVFGGDRGLHCGGANATRCRGPFPRRRAAMHDRCAAASCRPCGTRLKHRDGIYWNCENVADGCGRGTGRMRRHGPDEAFNRWNILPLGRPLGRQVRPPSGRDIVSTSIHGLLNERRRNSFGCSHFRHGWE